MRLIMESGSGWWYGRRGRMMCSKTIAIRHARGSISVKYAHGLTVGVFIELEYATLYRTISYLQLQYTVFLYHVGPYH